MSDTLSRFTLAVVVICASAVACNDDQRWPTDITEEQPATFVVSQPVTDATHTQAARSTMASGATGEAGIVYVSLQAGMFPTGMLATIRQRRSGLELIRPIVDGGLDPIGIAATIGDTIQVLVTDKSGTTIQTLSSVTPASRRPVVVRTIPPRRRADVPLNVRLVVVFSEPIRPSTANSIRLLAGPSAVEGNISVAADGLRIEFTPQTDLDRDRTYVLSIPANVTDLDGEALEGTTNVSFTTGSTTALSSVNTDQVAMFLNEFTGDPHTFEVGAVKRSDGRVDGSFTIFYPKGGWRNSGRITCYSIVDRTVWMAGVLQDAQNEGHLSTEWGWRMVDNGPPEDGVPDQLSLAIPIGAKLGSAEQFCSSLPTIDEEEDEIRLNNLGSGDIVVRTGGDLPVSPNVGMSRIAFAAVPNGGIRVMRADGLGVQTLTATTNDWSPTWSPDGAKLAFQRVAGNGISTIYAINADGTGLKQLTSGRSFDGNPAWSPDGKKIAFYDNGGISALNAADGSGAVQLTYDGAGPAWSPDGSRIAFWSGREGRWGIYVMNVDGSGVTRLTSDTMTASNPSWSPDGRSIAFQGGIDDHEGIYAMNSDGSSLRRLTFTVAQTAVWSPDGKKILFEAGGLLVMNADGSGMAGLGPGFTPSWSTGTMPVTPEPSVSMRIVEGDAQVDTVRATLAQPLKVQLMRDDGAPARGTYVNFRVSFASEQQQTSVSPVSAKTDSLGIASTTLTFGPIAGRVTGQVLTFDGSVRTSSLVFTATAQPGRPVKLYPVSGSTRLAPVDSTVEYALYARDGHGSCAEPACGNLTTAGAVNWAVVNGGGTIRTLPDTIVSDGSAQMPLSRALHALGPDEGATLVTAETAIAAAAGLTFTTTVVSKIVRLSEPTYSAATQSYYRSWMPDTADVAVGRTVGWTWSSDLDCYYDSSACDHNVSFEDDPASNSPTLTDGVFTRTFAGLPRTIRYRCTRHSTSFTDGEVGVVKIR